MHLKRVIVALIVIPLLYLYISKLPPLFFLILLTLISIGAQLEFHSMYKTKRLLSLLGVIGSIVFFFYAYAATQASGRLFAAYLNFLYPVLFMVFFMVIAAVRLFLIKNPENSLRDIAPVTVGFLYIPTLLLPQWFLRTQGYEWIFLLYGSVWAADSMAYYVGKGIGKRKLYKEVSPNKTVAGAFGSIAGGILAAVVVGALLNLSTNFFNDRLASAVMLKLVLIGALIGGVAILGDLVESMFKRDAGIKDSSTIIPGHGGFLDKADSVLFAGPILFAVSLIL